MNYHKCEVNDCKAQIPEKHLMCPPHWRKVPRYLQSVIVSSMQMRNQNYYSAVEMARQAASNTNPGDWRDLFSPAGAAPRPRRPVYLPSPRFNRRVG